MASAIGIVVWMIGRTAPASTSGQTCPRTPATILAFSPSGRARKRGRRDRPALGHQRAEVELALRPPCIPMVAIRPFGWQRRDVPAQVLRADDVQDHVGAARSPGRRDEVLARVVDRDVRTELRRAVVLGRPRGRTTRRAERLAELDGEGADPPPPPCTSSVSPLRSRAMSTTFDQTVQATSGSAAASCTDMPCGTGSSCPAGTATCSA